MTRQNKMKIQTQFKHLRFVDTEEGVILNTGGFTLAYRAHQLPAEGNTSKINIQAAYAYSECKVDENFDKKMGRNMAYHRLNNQAEDFSDSFDVTPQLPEGFENNLIVLKDGQVDIMEKHFNLSKAIVEHFLATWAEVLNVGTAEEGEGNLYENIIDYNGTIAIDASVLDFVPPTMESLMVEVATTITAIADGALDTLDNFNLEDPPSANASALELLRKAFADIKDLVSSMNEPEEEGDEEGDEESDMDEDDEESDEGDEEGDDDEEGGDEEEDEPK